MEKRCNKELQKFYDAIVSNYSKTSNEGRVRWQRYVYVIEYTAEQFKLKHKFNLEELKRDKK